MARINRKELVRMVEAKGAETACGLLLENLGTEGGFKPQDFSFRDLWMAFAVDNHGKPCGADLLLEMQAGMNSEKLSLLEASGAVSTGSFANITGQIVYNKVKEGYQLPDFIGDDLCEVVTTTTIDGEKIAGIGALGDVAQVVAEGDDYPYVGLNEDYTITVPTEKRGFLVPLTREAILTDKTGQILKRAQDTGEWMGLNKEKRILDAFFGITNTYNRNGTSTNTYLTSGAYINNQVNALTDWTTIEKAELLIEAVLDPNTGEPISAGGITTLIVPTALRWTAQRISRATDIQHVDNTASPTTIRTTSQNPLNGRTYRILSNTYVKLRSSSATTWFASGDPKKAMYYMQNWGIESLQAATNSEEEFKRDIVSRFKVSERGAVQMIEPRLLQKNTAS